MGGRKVTEARPRQSMCGRGRGGGGVQHGLLRKKKGASASFEVAGAGARFFCFAGWFWATAFTWCTIARGAAGRGAKVIAICTTRSVESKRPQPDFHDPFEPFVVVGGVGGGGLMGENPKSSSSMSQSLSQPGTKSSPNSDKSGIAAHPFSPLTGVANTVDAAGLDGGGVKATSAASGATGSKATRLTTF